MNLDERYFELWNSSKHDLCNHSLKLEQQLAKLKEENEKLRECLDEILTYAQYPSSKIAKEALGE